MSDATNRFNSESKGPWMVNENDLVGGWIISNSPKRMSEIDHRLGLDGKPNDNTYIIAECMDWNDAKWIAYVLNRTDKVRGT